MSLVLLLLSSSRGLPAFRSDVVGDNLGKHSLSGEVCLTGVGLILGGDCLSGISVRLILGDGCLSGISVGLILGEDCLSGF